MLCSWAGLLQGFWTECFLRNGNRRCDCHADEAPTSLKAHLAWLAGLAPLEARNDGRVQFSALRFEQPPSII